MARSRVDPGSQAAQQFECPDGHLRNAPGVMAAGSGREQSFPELSRDRGPAGGLYREDGVHACRISAVDRASFLWILGLSDNGIFRSDEPAWDAARPDVSDRTP